MTPHEILRAFADKPPLQRSDDEDHCIFCGASTDDYLEERDVEGGYPYRELDEPAEHLPSCPWRAANEYLSQEVANG